MKRLFAIFALLIIMIIFFIGCKKASLPQLITADITSIAKSSALTGGSVTEDGDSKITERGICWIQGYNDPSISDSKITAGTGSGEFTVTLSGLSPGTSYSVRAYAINKAGIAYGDIVRFFTIPPDIVFNPASTYGTMTDIDGNVYKTITIGTQVWMAENLKVSHYRNGDPVTFINSEYYEWRSDTTNGLSCYYLHNESIGSVYGKFYNWYAVNDFRGLAPLGWHIPLDAEWALLESYLGDNPTAGAKMKEAGTDHWEQSNSSGDNSSGFTALPGGLAEWPGLSHGMNNYTYFWSSTKDNHLYVWCYKLSYDISSLIREHMPTTTGISVRCIKD
jgi:uncharacterized protein (TIGR02145 family)